MAKLWFHGFDSTEVFNLSGWMGAIRSIVEVRFSHVRRNNKWRREWEKERREKESCRQSKANKRKFEKSPWAGILEMIMSVSSFHFQCMLSGNKSRKSKIRIENIWAKEGVNQESPWSDDFWRKEEGEWAVLWDCDHHLLRKKSHMHNFGKYMNIHGLSNVLSLSLSLSLHLFSTIPF